MQDGLYYVYWNHPNGGAVVPRHMGSFAIEHGIYHVVEPDHGHFLSNAAADGLLLDEQALSKLNALQNSMHVKVVRQEDFDQGHHLDLVPKGDVTPFPASQPPAKPKQAPSVFEYSDERMTTPVQLEHDRGAIKMNGQTLGNDETNRILDSIRQGKATVRYPKSKGVDMAKAETAFDRLLRSEYTPTSHPAAERYSRHPSIGSYLKFKRDEAPEGAVHVHVTFLSPNRYVSTHGELARDSLYSGLAEVVHKSGKGEKYHMGGDSFHIVTPDVESAFRYARNLSDATHALPHAGGVHPHHLVLGIGHSPDDAKTSHDHAFERYRQKEYDDTSVKSHAHSLVQGLEGHVPVGEARLPVPKLVSPL